MKNSRFLILLSFVLAFALTGCSNQEQLSEIENNPENIVINESNPKETITEEGTQELKFPQINRWKTVDYWQWWPDLIMELQNNNDENIDIEFNVEYFDEDWDSLWTSEGLYYIALKPQEKWFIRSSRNIPSAADIKVTPTYIEKSSYDDVSYKISKNKRIWDTVELDFDIEWEMSNAAIYIVFYNWDKVSTIETYEFFDKTESYHIYDAIESFDHYEIYAHIYK